MSGTEVEPRVLRNCPIGGHEQGILEESMCGWIVSPGATRVEVVYGEMRGEVPNSRKDAATSWTLTRDVAVPSGLDSHQVCFLCLHKVTLGRSPAEAQTR